MHADMNEKSFFEKFHLIRMFKFCFLSFFPSLFSKEWARHKRKSHGNQKQEKDCSLTMLGVAVAEKRKELTHATPRSGVFQHQQSVGGSRIRLSVHGKSQMHAV